MGIRRWPWVARGSHRRLLALCLGITLWVAGPATAHRGHGVWTDLNWSGDRFEIIHQLHLADALRLLAHIDSDTTIDSMEGLARLTLYVEDHFAVTVAGQPVTIETLGADIDDDFLYVYQEWITARPTTVPGFRSGLLREIEPTAETYVHYKTPDINRTLRAEVVAH